MMGEFQVKKAAADVKDMERIEALYMRAFPENERGDFPELFQKEVDCLEVYSFYAGQEFAGFACLLEVGDISHIIYLAVEERFRDRGYGSRALEQLHKQKTGKRVIVDIEDPAFAGDNLEQRQKRKQFYLRNGYRETEVKYRWKHENYEILVYGGTLTNREFSGFWKELDRKREKRKKCRK